ncbi:LuxR family transcriptional regulator [Pseudomonas sp. ok272]|uniref:autoinducer binding domain-containing protein n=1 Tax=unclassified Pseudomonas TaxID=196821 RepID=UPI0008B55AF9|nr:MULTISPECIES: autoinducer binding domain-containing protein [unclassified Pseudomonas]SEM93515.1 LuxR family transcriptional regulator [Pseudomonas sp. ok272]SFM94760.1 LuxR family transcriptional regulator [Pseudomonas sp. ok602]
MEIWKHVQLKQLTHESNIETAYKLAQSFFYSLGYEYCGFSITSPPTGQYFDRVNLNNYPHDWNKQYEQNDYKSIDPLVAHCQRSMLPIVWDRETFAQVPELWQALMDQGLQYGWSQPVHDLDNHVTGMLSMARSTGRISAYELYDDLGYALIISQKLHALALQARRSEQPHGIDHGELSPRETEILKWSSHGKTASDIATILNLSERTVNFHVSRAIKKLGVTNKISAVVMAARGRLI